MALTQAGVFLLELTSRGGIVTGNRHLWDREKDGHTITVDSPLTLERTPWIEPMVQSKCPFEWRTSS